MMLWPAFTKDRPSIPSKRQLFEMRHRSTSKMVPDRSLISRAIPDKYR